MTRHLLAAVALASVSFAAVGNTVASGQEAALPPVAFEAASIKPNDGTSPGQRLNVQPGGRLIVVNLPARQLITFAYQIQPYQLINAPAWVNEARWDITATLPSGTVLGAPPGGGPGPVPRAMRTLLADRFKLVLRNENREQDIYALTLAREDGRPGPELKPAAPPCTPDGLAKLKDAPPEQVKGVFCGFRNLGPGRLVVTGMQMPAVANQLATRVGRFVVDRTGLTGGWDFTLTSAPDQGVGVPPDPNLPSLFTALQEQLGLKLEPTRAAVPVVVVETIEMPTPD